MSLQLRETSQNKHSDIVKYNIGLQLNFLLAFELHCCFMVIHYP